MKNINLLITALFALIVNISFTQKVEAKKEKQSYKTQYALIDNEKLRIEK